MQNRIPLKKKTKRKSCASVIMKPCSVCLILHVVENTGRCMFPVCAADFLSGRMQLPSGAHGGRSVYISTGIRLKFNVPMYIISATASDHLCRASSTHFHTDTCRHSGHCDLRTKGFYIGAISLRPCLSLSGSRSMSLPCTQHACMRPSKPRLYIHLSSFPRQRREMFSSGWTSAPTSSGGSAKGRHARCRDHAEIMLCNLLEARNATGTLLSWSAARGWKILDPEGPACELI